MVSDEEASDMVIENLNSKGFAVKDRNLIIADIRAIRARELKGTKDVTDTWHERKLKNSAGDNPYLFDCPWCGAKKGCLCTNEKGTEYTDDSYHRARLMKDCLEQADSTKQVE